LDGLLAQVGKVGKYFVSQLQQLKASHDAINEVRGMGLMLAIDLKSAEVAKAVVANLLDKGILINRTHDTVLRFLPPYIVEKKHVDSVIAALDSALKGGKAFTTQGAKVHAVSMKNRPTQHRKEH